MRIEVAGDSAVIAIEPLARDGEWWHCAVHAEIADFSASVRADLSHLCLSEFCRQLRQAVSRAAGRASFEGYGEGLQLAVEINSRGHAQISGEVATTFVPRVKMVFSFESDQTYLGATCKQLESFLRVPAGAAEGG